MQIELFHVWLQDLSGDYGFDRARENGRWDNTLVIARRDNVSSPCAIKLDAQGEGLSNVDSNRDKSYWNCIHPVVAVGSCQHID